MTLTLQNQTIALAEGRQLEELAEMLEKEGAQVLRCPLLSILDAPDEKPVLDWLRRLVGDQIDWLVLLTGEGVRRLVGLAERHEKREPVVAALGRVRSVTRGPKPVKALKDIGVLPTVVAPSPTTDGVIASLRAQEIRGKRVGVQLYSESNPPLSNFLREAGAIEDAVQPYVYAPASDGARVAELLEQMATGAVDAIVFTSSPQVERLFEVAEGRDLTDVLRSGLARTKVASVGPVLTTTLHAHGVRVDISPEQGFVMKNLVNQIKRVLGSV
jgi:uroporphyrinogen-III synthase